MKTIFEDFSRKNTAMGNNPGQSCPTVNDRNLVNYGGKRQSCTIIVYGDRIRCFAIYYDDRKLLP